MRQNIMKKWVKALRSDKYKQGEGLLKQKNLKGDIEYCCLGVLCDLYNKEMKKNKKETLTETLSGDMYIFNMEADILPKVVQNWAKMKDSVGTFQILKDKDNIGKYVNLVDMNDSGCSFKKIAKTIEKEWENL